VEVDGDAETTTTALTFTFSEAVSDLTADHITLNGGGATKGMLSGNGTSWTLDLTAIETACIILVSIAKDGIETGGKSVTVYKQNPLDITYTVAADGNVDTTTSALTFTFSETVSDLTADDITVTDVTKGTLTGGETSWTLTLTAIETAGNITVSITKGGIETGEKQVTVYKQMPPDLSLTEALAWLSVNAAEGGLYTITLKENESIAPATLFYEEKIVGIILTGDSAERSVSLSEAGSLFTVGNKVTLTLDSNLTLQGEDSNKTSLVRVYGGGALVMNTGSKITGSGSSGVEVEYSGTFTMSGGEISGNGDVNNGGGVYVFYSGTFTMSGGEISGNKASNGGGVYVSDGSAFTKTGQSVISGDTDRIPGSTENTATSGNGHAVYVESSSITPARIRNTTAGLEVDPDSGATGSWGGWEGASVLTPLERYLADLRYTAVEGGEYTYVVQSDESIAPQTLSYGGKAVSITLKGNTVKRTLSLNQYGTLFTVGDRVTLILDDHLALQGRSDNTSALVRVDNGTLVMNAGSKISGNGADYGGDGVYVSDGAFVMNGGEIHGNSGHGVYLWSGSIFEMTGGEIHGNTGNGVSGGTVTISSGEIYGNTGSGVSGSDTFTMTGGKIYENTGNGVYSGGTFTMSGGEIHGNTGSGVVSSGGSTFTMSGGEIYGNTGNGVYSGGTFTMSGYTKIRENDSGGVSVTGAFIMSDNAVISGNTISGVGSRGGGVYVNGTFEMSGNTVISDNTTGAGNNGGGVYFNGTFEMSGNAKISDNEAGGNGGGVCFYNGAFAMSGSAVISGNTASGTGTYSGGGGVYIAGGYNSTFTMSDSAVISGNTVSGTGTNSGGGGVYVYFNGTFEMSGSAVIRGNTASRGGGVYVGSGNFSKTGGTIYGDTDSTPYPDNGNATDNTATQGNTYGHAVYYNYFNEYYRDAPLNAGDNIGTETLPDSGTGHNWTKK
jgi:hypothetical protein